MFGIIIVYSKWLRGIYMIDYILNYSLNSNQKIAIIYQKGLEISQRDIKVLAIYNDTIYAYCYTRKLNRRFRKDRILAAMIPGLLKNSIYGDNYIQY